MKRIRNTLTITADAQSGAIACIVLLLIAMDLNPASFARTKNLNGREKSADRTIQKVRQLYTSQTGVREKQPNAGPQVEKYLRYVGLSKGQPWCAAFVCWVYGQAGVPNPRTGWSPSLFPVSKIIWSRKGRSSKLIKSCRLPVASCLPVRQTGLNHAGKFRIVSKTDALQNFYIKSSTRTFQALFYFPKEVCRKPIHPNLNPDRRSSCRQQTTGNRQPKSGDAFGIFFPSKGRIAHTGFIDQWDGTWLVTVEGNTNDSGSREGDGVYRKRRLVSSIYKVARYINGS